ncbi:hypothetical protein HKCCE3408_13690 [Rhodobacterales bacterium HKCCE3408]|nr:hypothetical protein [Rhodobacterales bacterium HKCCE3408]
MYNYIICNSSEIRDRATGKYLGVAWLEDCQDGKWSAVVVGKHIQAESPKRLKREIARRVKQARQSSQGSPANLSTRLSELCNEMFLSAVSR